MLILNIKILKIIFLSIVILTTTIAAAWAIKYYTADIRGRINANEQIKSGASRIVNYNHFFNVCASIQTTESQIDFLTKAKDQTNDPAEVNRLIIAIAGVESARAGSINQYNADASKNYTEGQFRDSDLPFQIPLTNYTGVKTKCAY